MWSFFKAPANCSLSSVSWPVDDDEYDVSTATLLLEMLLVGAFVGVFTILLGVGALLTLTGVGWVASVADEEEEEGEG